jgi:glucokinase
MTKGILRSKAISDAFEAKDELVTMAVTQAAEFMGMGLATVMNFYNPERIIMGGGLVEALEPYLTIATKVAKHRALKVPARKIQIMKAELGDYAGIIGAAMMLRDKV